MVWYEEYVDSKGKYWTIKITEPQPPIYMTYEAYATSESYDFYVVTWGYSYGEALNKCIAKIEEKIAPPTPMPYWIRILAPVLTGSAIMALSR